MNSTLRAALFLLLLISLCHARDDSSPNVQFELQIITLPEPLASALIPDLRDPKKIEAAYTRLQTLLGEGKATLVAWPVLATKSGQRAVVEDIREIRYATEFSGGEVQVNLQVTESPEEEPSQIKVKPKIEAAGLQPVPSAFETRNAGVTLEIEPVLAPDGVTIDLNLVPQHVWLHRFHTVTMKVDGRSVVVEQPEFRTNKVQTSITMKSGQRVLMGVFSQSERGNEMELFLLRGEIKAVE